MNVLKAERLRNIFYLMFLFQLEMIQYETTVSKVFKLFLMLRQAELSTSTALK